jgi:hypothetical protein
MSPLVPVPVENTRGESRQQESFSSHFTSLFICTLYLLYFLQPLFFVEEQSTMLVIRANNHRFLIAALLHVFLFAATRGGSSSWAAGEGGGPEEEKRCYFPIVYLDREDQLLVLSPTGKTTKEGPGIFFFMPFVSTAIKRKAVLVDETQYVILKDHLTGVQQVKGGPQLLYLGPYEEAIRTKNKILLRENEYVKLTSSTTGAVRMIHGPQTVIPSPHEEVEPVYQAIALGATQYAKLMDERTGQIRIQKQESLVFPGPFERVVAGPLEAISLLKHEFVRLTNEKGEIRVETGEKLVFPEPLETFERKQKGYQLMNHQYIKLVDVTTGIVRVEKGEQLVFPSPTEAAVGEQAIQDAVFVDTETAVLVLSKQSGQQNLVTEKNLFFPGPYEEILEVRKLIRVQPHEVAVVVDNKSKLHFYDGRSNGESGVAFFLPPHHELYTMYWGSGTSPDDLKANRVRNAKTVAYKIPVQKIDLRATYAFFEYNVRTSDNVELVLEGTIFWQVLDVPKMVAATGDPKGDIWYHARSALIQAVSMVTLEEFMKGFNTIVSSAAATDALFYDDRGCKVHNLEVTRYECADAATGSVLQQIIQETTNRINALQKQASANDVRKTQIDGDIQVEQQRTELVQIQTANDQLLASEQGKAEGLRLAMALGAFSSNLEEIVPSLQSRLDLFQFFSTNDLAGKQIHSIANGNAHLFLTPESLNLKFHTTDPKNQDVDTSRTG